MNQNDLQQLNATVKELRDQVYLLQQQVAAISEHVGLTAAPVAPAAPLLPEHVNVLLEQGDRGGAVLALAEAWGIDERNADVELRTRGL